MLVSGLRQERLFGLFVKRVVAWPIFDLLFFEFRDNRIDLSV